MYRPRLSILLVGINVYEHPKERDLSMANLSIKVLRGTNTIGGSCIQLECQGTRIILDLGMPLMESGGDALDSKATAAPSVDNGILPDVPGLYNGQEPQIKAVFISHAHPDHYGLIRYIHPGIPIYMGDSSLELLKIGNIFYPASLKQPELQKITTFTIGKTIEVGPFSITAYLVDHSAFGACAFMIEAQGKKILYTGDFRDHGRKSTVLDYLIGKVGSPVDVLLMEGTTIDGRHKRKFDSEQAVEDGLVEYLKGHSGHALCLGSGTNVDRLVTLYRACKRANRLFVIDLFQLYVLLSLKKFAAGLPPFADDHLRVFYIKSHRDTVVDKIGKQFLNQHASIQIKMDEIVQSKQPMLLRLPASRLEEIANRLKKEGQPAPSPIFSMWSGYLDMQPRLHEIEKISGSEFAHFHTSGHAYLAGMKKLVEGVKPKQLIPIHTLNKRDFSSYFSNVVVAEDHQVIDV